MTRIPYWSRYKKLFGTRKWSPNMGDTLLGVIAEYSPKATQVHKPKYINNTPLRTIASSFERSNTARLYRHKFESPQFNWLPSFRDIRKSQLAFAMEDLNRQVAFGFDDFVRWQILQFSPYMFVCGATNPVLSGIPVGPPGEGTLVDPKTTAFFQSVGAAVGTNGYLDYKNICAVRSAARNVLGMVPWDGAPGTPADNKIMSGNWLLMGEPQIYEALSFDEHVLNNRPLAMNLLNKEFMGIISDNIVFRQEMYALRMAADGTFPAPEIESAYPANATVTTGTSTTTDPGGALRSEVIPNPDYVNAAFGFAFFFGNKPYEALDVGPPPSEFTNGQVDGARIAKMSWNGEVKLTDKLLINYGSASGLTVDALDFNKYGEFLQLICDTTLGLIPNTPRFCMPIIYRRDNYPSLSPGA